MTGSGSRSIMPMMRATTFFASRSPIEVISVDDPGLKMAFQSTSPAAAHQVKPICRGFRMIRRRWACMARIASTWLATG